MISQNKLQFVQLVWLQLTIVFAKDNEQCCQVKDHWQPKKNLIKSPLFQLILSY